jgi:hypothetical protein
VRAAGGLSATLALRLGQHPVGVDLVDELGQQAGLAAGGGGGRVLAGPAGERGDASTLAALRLG